MSSERSKKICTDRQRVRLVLHPSAIYWNMGTVDDLTDSLREQISAALVADVAPERLESYNFSVGILPGFRLLHYLFYGDELDTCLKLMVLFEVSRTSGRFGVERIRSLVSFLDSSRVDGIVRSLKDGGWLDLRASDNTYTLSTIGLQLIALLHAADLHGLSPTNALSRAAQNAQFRSTLDGADGVTAYLLDQLLCVLENQVADAQSVLQYGRPYRLIAWTRREHGHQLSTIREVLTTIETHTDSSSKHFTRVVRLHEAMEQIIAHQTGINTRLRDWNLERLHSSDTGYSLHHLAEAVMGIEDQRSLEQLLADGVVQGQLPAPSLTTDEIRTRFQGARRKLISQKETFDYAPPVEPIATSLSASEVDPATELRARWTRLFEERTPQDPPLELNDWIERQTFGGVVYELALMSRLAYGGQEIELLDGRKVELTIITDRGEGATADQLLSYLEDRGAMQRLSSGWFSRVTLSLLDDLTSETDQPIGEQRHG
ncbi:MAG: hypothetical protein GY847_28010 [Proteobacteria bacterium]|nr:hypothetical protein [Pseudomonadota bacterium]